ncbi:MAG: translation initiation factor [Candidatus Omnitrophica bacterium]|nr:translation initiation factor [Candidatus Omnitrophota bacterium]
MQERNKKHRQGTVYSTDPDFQYDYGDNAERRTLSSEKQNLRVRLDAKKRCGKVVTLVDGFVGACADMQRLGKMIKTQCGTGGSVKDGVIIVQGDMREKIAAILTKCGYKYTVR